MRRPRSLLLALTLLPAAVLPFAAAPARAEEAAVPQSEFCKTMRARQTDWQAVKERVHGPALRFAASFYRQVAASTHGNLAVSPFSVDAALAMTAAGARGETLEEVAKAMHLAVPMDAAWHQDMGAFLAHLTCPAEHRSRELDIANRLFVQQGKALLPGYTELVRANYEATPAEVDFQKNADGARRIINEWVGKATHEKINELIGPHLLTADAKLVLVNAVFLRDRWETEFEPANTKPRAFHLTAARTVKVPMMAREGKMMDMSFAEMPGFRAVAMKTADHSSSLVLLVPTEVEGLAKLEGGLDGTLLEHTLGALKMRQVNLTMPKFKVSGDLSLKQPLEHLGIKRLFVAKHADLGGMDGGKDQLFIGAAVHQAAVDVNETGFEAAAATAMMGFAGGAPPQPTEPVTVVADRPFLFVIRDTGSRVPLFMGRVADPSH